LRRSRKDLGLKNKGTRNSKSKPHRRFTTKNKKSTNAEGEVEFIKTDYTNKENKAAQGINGNSRPSSPKGGETLGKKRT